MDCTRRRSLFVFYEKRLRRFARRLATNEDEANELFQDLAVAVLAHRTGPDDQQKFAGWCCGIARHLAAHRRRSHARKPLHGQHDDDLEALASAPDEDPERTAIVRQRLTSGLAGLDGDALTLLVERFVLEETAAEMAARLKLSPASVRMRVARLVATLRDP